MKSFLYIFLLGASAHYVSAFHSTAPKASVRSCSSIHTFSASSSCRVGPASRTTPPDAAHESRPQTALSAGPIPLSVPILAAVGSNIATFYKTFPIMAGFLTASIKASFADRLAQYRDVCTEKFDWKRNIAMVLYSGIILGASCEVMYNRIFPIMFGRGEKTLLLAAKMTLFDGLVNAPFFWLPPAYIAKALVYGYPMKEAMHKYMLDVNENGLLKKYWSLWIPVSLINFMWIPDHFRIAFVAFISFFWMTILSVVANNDQKVDECPLEPDVGLLNPRALD